MKVFIAGGQSGPQQGAIIDIAADQDFPIFGPLRNVSFYPCIVTTRISEFGDSGSVLLNEKWEALGLLFAQGIGGIGGQTLATFL